MGDDPRNLKWVIPASTFFLEEEEEELWLIDRILPLTGIAVLAGEPKAGKTELALEFALSVVSGKPAMEIFFPTQVGPVLYVASEGGRKRIRDRIFALARPKGLEPAGLPLDLVTRDANFLVDTEPWQAAIEAQIKKRGYRMIVLDPFANIHFANESAQHEISRVTGFLSAISERYQVTVLVLHHLRKKNSKASAEEEELSVDRIRGSSAIRGWYDTGILVAREETADSKDALLAVLREHRDSDDDDLFRARISFRRKEGAARREARWTLHPTEMPHRDARILRCLLRGALHVREIAQATHVEQPLAEKRLQRLSDLDLVVKVAARQPERSRRGRLEGRPESGTWKLTPRGWFSATGRTMWDKVGNVVEDPTEGSTAIH